MIRMKINIVARLKNKTFVISAIALIIAFVYRFLSVCEIVPKVGETEIVEVIGMFIDILVFFGILVDPTTEGVSDSDRAMGYYSVKTNMRSENNE